MDKKDLSSLFKKKGNAIGLDDESSAIIIRNLNAGTIPMCVGSPFTADEEETDEFKIICFVLDGSGSMCDVADMLVNEFNDTVIPGLKEGKKNIVAGMRVGGLVFGSKIDPLWAGGFQPIADLPVLTTAEYRAYGSTALYQAVLDALTASSAYALQIKDKTGTNPEVTIIVLSDGANNQPPMDADEVYKVTSVLSPELFKFAFAGFETGERVDFKQVAKDIGFNDVFEMKMKPGESFEDRKRRFRHMIGVMSSSLVGHVSKSVVASSGQSASFWQP